MPINLAGGYTAGGVHDALLEIVKQRMLEQELAQREEENQFQRLRQNRLDTRQEQETTYQHGRDTAADTRLSTADRLAAEELQRSLAVDKLKLQEGQPGTDLVPQEKWKMQATPGLPPSLGGREPQLPLWRGDQQDVPPVDIPWVGQRRPRTKEELDAERKRLLDEASQRNIDEAEARRVPRDVAKGSLEDYLMQKYGPRPTPAQMMQGRKDYNMVDDRPPTLLRIETAGPNGNVTRFVSPSQAQGKDFAAKLTNTQQDRRDALTRVKPIFSGLVELADKINTQQGLMATIAGTVEKQAAKVNLDNDVAEYQALINLGTPMIARAVGHVGVLTQQDVESVIRGLPTATDSEDLKDRKVKRVASLFGWDVDAVRALANETMGGSGGGGGPKVGETRTANGETRTWNGTEWVK